MGQRNIRIGDVIKIIRRRRLGFMATAFCIFLVSVVVVIVWKPVYRSTSIILIEEQEISRDYVLATVSSYAEERLQTINQRIMSGARLIQIINQFNLYADEREKLTTEEIIENMRDKDIKFKNITADVVDRRTGRLTAATIAFSVSYEGKNPVVVQQVANVLASLYLEENIKVVGQQTESTTKFFKEEMGAVKADFSKLERQVAVYKEKHSTALPELLQFNLQAMDWSEKNYEQLNGQLRTHLEKESSLQSELATMSPDTTHLDKERLSELQVTLVSLRARYSDEYPDVIKTKNEIETLGMKLNSRERDTEVVEKPTNARYITLSSQLASVQSELGSVRRQIESAGNKIKMYRKRLEMSPGVEEGYRSLVVERNSTQAKYDDLMKKYMDAKVAAGLEKGQLGERFTLIDPARLPEKPVRPNRSVILLIGLFLGIGAGIATVSLQEAVDWSARSAEDLMAVFSLPVLVEIPEILTLEDELRKRTRMRLAIGTSVLLMVALVPVVHFFVMDIDLVWTGIVRRLPW